MTDGASTEGREDFDKRVFAPPASTKAEEMRDLPEWQPDAQADLFMAQLAARGGDARTSG
jgi:hypothetical protein